MATLTGTFGDDVLVGARDKDEFHLEQGGEDKASGSLGADDFFMGAAFDTEDSIDGGPGEDTIVLAGTYAGFVFRSSTISRIEKIQLTAGFSYAFSGLDKVEATGLLVDGHQLAAADHLAFDATSLTTGVVTLLGGDGDDTLTGGGLGDSLDGGHGADLLQGAQGDDTLVGVSGVDTLEGGFGDDLLVAADLTKGARFDGGGGFDILQLPGATYSLGGQAVTGVEQLAFAGDTVLSFKDSFLAAGQSLAVRVVQGLLDFDGSRERDGAFAVAGAGQADHIVGGAGADTLDGRKGDDSLHGGGGADTLTGGGGRDHFLYAAVADSAPGAADLIADLEAKDVLDLSAIDADPAAEGDQAFRLAAHFSGKPGQLVIAYDAARDLTTFSGDLDGDATADLLITAAGDHRDFAGLVL